MLSLPLQPRTLMYLVVSIGASVKKAAHKQAIRRINESIRKLVGVFNDTRRFCSKQVAHDFPELDPNQILRLQDPSNFFYHEYDPAPNRNARWLFVRAYHSIRRIEEERGLLCRGARWRGYRY